jgi:hypothetical protein
LQPPSTYFNEILKFCAEHRLRDNKARVSARAFLIGEDQLRLTQRVV